MNAAAAGLMLIVTLISRLVPADPCGAVSGKSMHVLANLDDDDDVDVPWCLFARLYVYHVELHSINLGRGYSSGSRTNIR